MAVAVALGLLAVAVALGVGGAGRASAAPVPIYNAPPGGGAVTKETVKVGPIHLDAMGGAHWQDEASDVVPRPAGAYGLKSMTFDLVDGNGVPFDRMAIHLHHFVIASVFHKDPVCPDRKVSGAFVAPLAGTGAERTPISFPDPYAVLVGEKDVWGATWHLMNMSGQPQDVYIQYEVGYQPGANATNTRNLVPYFADVDGCGGDAVFDVPGDGGPGSIFTKSTSFTVPQAGIMVGTGGHLHDGGIDTELYRGDGSLLCRSTANYDGMNMIESITPCPVHDTVAAGEKFDLTARYDNSTPHPDVMGINMAFFWFGDQGTPPTTTSTSTSSTTTTSTVASTTTSTTTATVAAATAAQPVTAQPTLAG